MHYYWIHCINPCTKCKYQTIIDIKSVYFTNLTVNDSLVLKFLLDLNAAKKEIESKSAVIWSRSNYKLWTTEKDNAIYLGDIESDGYTWLMPRHVDKLITWFDSIGFKSN